MSLKITYKSKSRSSNTILAFVFIVTFCISFMQNTFVFEYSYFSKYIISIFWILLAITKMLINSKKKKVFSKDIYFYLKMFLIPWIIFTINNFFIFSIGRGTSEFFGRSITSFSTMIITVLVAFATVYIFEEKVISYSIITIIISFIIITINGLIKYGFFSVFQVIFETALYGQSSINFYEVNDLNYGAGLLLILFLFVNKRRTMKNILLVLFTFTFVILGLKRIQMLALIIILFFVIFIKTIRNIKNKSRFIMLTSIVVISGAYIFVYIIDKGIFTDIIKSLGINTMGRLNFYNFIAGYYDFSINYLGRGLGFTSKAIETYTYWKYTLHSDILMMYVEMGFVVFGFWLWYSLWYCYKKILKERSFEEAITYFILTLYLFIMHFTDNTLTYFTTQYIYMMIPVCLYISKNRS